MSHLSSDIFPLVLCTSLCACVPGIPSSGAIVDPILEPTICSMATMGLELGPTLRVQQPAATAVGLDRVVREAQNCGVLCSDAGRVPAWHVRAETPHGAALGWYSHRAAARGLVVYFAGIGQSAAGDLALLLEREALEAGFAVLRMERDDVARPLVLDPVREALRAVALAGALYERLGISGPRVYAGVSLGGMEAALAAREDPDAISMSRDPLLSPMAAARWLDQATLVRPDALQMRKFFVRMMLERYGEEIPISFSAVLERSREGMTDPVLDAPSRWLCELEPEERARYQIELSAKDPALGPENAAGLVACEFPVRWLKTSGHVPIACESDAIGAMFSELVATLPLVDP